MHYTDLALPHSRLPAGASAHASWLAATRHDDNTWPAVKPTMPAWLANSVGDRLFIDMLHAFRPTGGLARESELLARWRSLHGTGAAGWHEALGAEPLLRFEWSGAVWLPLFQFKPSELVLNPAATAVVAELSPHYDGWSLANWFAQPNTWLGEQRPVDVLNHNPAHLLEAARVDRFIVAG